MSGPNRLPVEKRKWQVTEENTFWRPRLFGHANEAVVEGFGDAPDAGD
jgi:hypothetical protein